MYPDVKSTIPSVQFKLELQFRWWIWWICMCSCVCIDDDTRRRINQLLRFWLLRLRTEEDGSSRWLSPLLNRVQNPGSNQALDLWACYSQSMSRLSETFNDSAPSYSNQFAQSLQPIRFLTTRSFLLNIWFADSLFDFYPFYHLPRYSMTGQSPTEDDRRLNQRRFNMW